MTISKMQWAHAQGIPNAVNIMGLVNSLLNMKDDVIVSDPGDEPLFTGLFTSLLDACRKDWDNGNGNMRNHENPWVVHLVQQLVRYTFLEDRRQVFSHAMTMITAQGIANIINNNSETRAVWPDCDNTLWGYAYNEIQLRACLNEVEEKNGLTYIYLDEEGVSMYREYESSDYFGSMCIRSIMHKRLPLIDITQNDRGGLTVTTRQE